jgi:hypothetical protein
MDCHNPIVTYNVVPVVGGLPLTVQITNLVIEGLDGLDAVSMAHWGAFDGYSGELCPEKLAVWGAFYDFEEYSFQWQFGDGDTSDNITPLFHTYNSVGTFTLKLVLTVGEEVFEYPTEISVVSVPVPATDLIQDTDRVCFNFAAEQKEGHGWSEFGGDDFIWLDTFGSIITGFQAEDEFNVGYDVNTGLPYILDVRKNYDFPKITYKDKTDLLIDDSGTEIESELKLNQMKASEESFSMEPSDLKVYFKPMRRANKGAEGFTAFGLPEDFKFDVSLYLNIENEATSTLFDAVYGRELYFKDGKPKTGNIIEYGLKMYTSNYIFTKLFADFIVYDKAMFPFAEETNEETIQNNLMNLTHWLTRWNYKYEQICYRQLITDFDIVKGPDEKTGSAFEIAAETPALNIDNDVSKVVCWSTNENGVKGTVTIKDVFQDGEPWFLLEVDVDPNDVTLLAGKFFDVRFYNNNIIDNDALDYIYRDVTLNEANSICPV